MRAVAAVGVWLVLLVGVWALARYVLALGRFLTEADTYSDCDELVRP